MMIKVYGTPVPKGSMKCIGARGRGKHTLIDNKAKLLAVWMPKVQAAAEKLRDRVGTLAGPVAVATTYTVERPASVPLKKRVWPVTRSAGDIDKCTRAILDALTAGQLLGDDSQVVHVDDWQCYPDTPGVVDRLDRPGVIIRIEQL